MAAPGGSHSDPPVPILFHSEIFQPAFCETPVFEPHGCCTVSHEHDCGSRPDPSTCTAAGPTSPAIHIPYQAQPGNDTLVQESLLLCVQIFCFSHRSDGVRVRHHRDFLLYYRRHRVSIQIHAWLRPDFFDVSFG